MRAQLEFFLQFHVKAFNGRQKYEKKRLLKEVLILILIAFCWWCCSEIEDDVETWTRQNQLLSEKKTGCKALLRATQKRQKDLLTNVWKVSKAASTGKSD